MPIPDIGNMTADESEKLFVKILGELPIDRVISMLIESYDDDELTTISEELEHAVGTSDDEEDTDE